MQLELTRIRREPLFTVGELRIDGQLFCHTLEDTDRGLRNTDPLDEIYRRKVFRKTAIPSGRYKTAFRFSPKYGREMPSVLDVPGFTGIRIHSGNTADDTSGCILLGEWRGGDHVVNSRRTVKRFEQMLRDDKAGAWELEIN